MTNKYCYLLKLKYKNFQNIKSVSPHFAFLEVQMHQNQSVYFHLYATILLDKTEIYGCFKFQFCTCYLLCCIMPL